MRLIEFTERMLLYLTGSSNDAQSWNRYAYTGNNPVVRIDPDGMKWMPGTQTPKPRNGPFDWGGPECPMCIRVKAGRNVEGGKQKAKDLEQKAYDNYLKKKTKYDEVFGAWGYTSAQVQEMYTPGKVPKVKLKTGMKNYGLKAPGLPAWVNADTSLTEQASTVNHELVHRTQGRRGITPGYLPTSSSALNTASVLVGKHVTRFHRSEFIAYALEAYLNE